MPMLRSLSLDLNTSPSAKKTLSPRVAKEFSPDGNPNSSLGISSGLSKNLTTPQG